MLTEEAWSGIWKTPGDSDKERVCKTTQPGNLEASFSPRIKAWPVLLVAAYRNDFYFAVKQEIRNRNLQKKRNEISEYYKVYLFPTKRPTKDPVPTSSSSTLEYNMNELGQVLETIK